MDELEGIPPDLVLVESDHTDPAAPGLLRRIRREHGRSRCVVIVESRAEQKQIFAKAPLSSYGADKVSADPEQYRLRSRG